MNSRMTDGRQERVDVTIQIGSIRAFDPHGEDDLPAVEPLLDPPIPMLKRYLQIFSPEFRYANSFNDGFDVPLPSGAE